VQRRVTLVVPEYPPHSVGGGGIAYRAIAHSIHAQGRAVRVLTGDSRGVTRKDLDGPIEVLRFGLLPYPARLPFLNGYMPPYPTTTLRDRLALIDENEIVHVHGLFLGFCDAVSLAMLRRRRPYFLTNHGYPQRIRQLKRPYYDFMRLYERIVVARVARGALGVSAISQFCAVDGPLAERPIEIIPNGIDVGVFDDPGERPSSNLIFVGRLQPDKGTDIALRALAQAKGAVLTVIGPDAGEREHLERLARGLGVERRVVFRGALPREDVMGEQRRAYAMLMPSLNEPFGLVGLEAMANGSLLVCSDRGGHRSYANETNALLFQTGNATALAGVLKQFPLEHERYRSIRAHAFDTSKAHTWSKVAERYLEWYARFE